MSEGYKLTELGRLPKDWQVVSIDSFTKVLTGSTPPTKDVNNYGGPYPWVTPTDIGSRKNLYKTDRTLTDKGLNSGRKIPKNSVLVTCIASIGKNAIIRIDGSCNQQINAVLPSLEHNPDYLFYYIEYQKERLVKLSASTAVPIINKSTFEKFKVVLPPINEQHLIAEILSKMDEKIDVINAQISQTQELKKGLMQQLLTRGIGHTQFKSSPLGEIPDSWSYGKIADFCAVHNNLRKPISAEIRKEMQGDYPYYGPTGIVDYINEYLIDGEYTLIGEDGDHFLKFDTWSMTSLVSGKFNVNNHAHSLQGKAGCFTAWIHVFFQHRNIVPFLTRQGAGRYKLTKETLLQLPMLLPPIEEQKEIAEILFIVDSKKNLLQEKKKVYQELKRGLMQKLLTGKIRVNQTNCKHDATKLSHVQTAKAGV